MPNIVGLSAYYHDSACCLMRDGVLIAAAQEERFSRIKHDRNLPRGAFRYCLEEGNISVQEVDCIAYYESPVKKLARQLWMDARGIHPDAVGPVWSNAKKPEGEIRSSLGYDGPIQIFEHHHSHAASSYYFSGFDDAAILTVDGVGEFATTTYGRATGKDLEIFEEVQFPDSLGLLYSAITNFLGFSVNDGEYKVMGLAPYGNPRYVREMRTLVQSLERGQYRLNLEYFDFLSSTTMFSESIEALFGLRARKRGSRFWRLTRTSRGACN